MPQFCTHTCVTSKFCICICIYTHVREGKGNSERLRYTARRGEGARAILSLLADTCSATPEGFFSQ